MVLYLIGFQVRDSEDQGKVGGIEEMEGKVKVKVKVVSECVVYVSFLHMEV